MMKGAGGKAMGYAQALNVYKETKVKTASQGALIVMLYEEAIKHMDAAAALVAEDLKKDPSKIEKANTHILSSGRILSATASQAVPTFSVSTR